MNASRASASSANDPQSKLHDVAIIGLGPTGDVLASLLGALGLSVLVIEKSHDVYPLPRAAHFDGETMRVFQTIGLMAQILPTVRPGTQGMHFENAQGQTLLVRTASDKPGPHGFANNWYFHQPDLERILRAGLARHPNVTVLLGQEVTGIETGDDSVRLTFAPSGPDEWDSPPGPAPIAAGGSAATAGGSDAAAGGSDAAAGAAPADAGPTDTGGRVPATIRARYVVGCDGGRSGMRRAIGSTMDDLGLHQPWLCLDMIMEREVDLPVYTVQLCDPQRPMTVVNMAGRRRRWEIMLMPGDDPATVAEPDSVWRLLARWIKPGDARIERSAIYTFHSLIAQGWRRGRLLLAGDAAHQTPPFLGQGMCAGVRDAANLAWKLARVIRDGADDALLDTYESEREPHVREFIALAVRVGDVIQTTDPSVAAERDRRFAESGPELFAFPLPVLGPGVHTSDGRHAGSIIGQPTLADGRPMDAAIGYAFALIVAGDLAPDARRALADAGARLSDATVPVRLLDADTSGIGDTLRALGARAVLIRPDRYIVGTADDAAGLTALLACID
ncbi:MAG: bifunctional 3-(3-hydroxy-phenyl)propionate/3-hydroxycinnamic acid hydroxylase [Burkholderiaceae bacterium]